jgi:hypothetical protein
MGSEALGYMPYVNEPFARPSAFEGRFNFILKQRSFDGELLSDPPAMPISTKVPAAFFRAGQSPDFQGFLTSAAVNRTTKAETRKISQMLKQKGYKSH